MWVWGNTDQSVDEEKRPRITFFNLEKKHVLLYYELLNELVWKKAVCYYVSSNGSCMGDNKVTLLSPHWACSRLMALSISGSEPCRRGGLVLSTSTATLSTQCTHCWLTSRDHISWNGPRDCVKTLSGLTEGRGGLCCVVRHPPRLITQIEALITPPVTHCRIAWSPCSVVADLFSIHRGTNGICGNM